MKKLIASVLSICLLLGMFSGIQVDAMGYTAEDALGVNLVQAVAMPEEWSYSIPDLDHDRVIIPIFSKSMGNTYNSTKKTSLCLTLVGKSNNYSLGDALGNPLSWTVSMQWNTAIPSPNCYYARLDSSKMLHLLPAKLTDEQRQKYTTDIDTVSEIIQLAEDLDCRLMFRMWEQGTGITTGDGYVDSYYHSETCLKGNLTVTASGNVSTNSASNVYDCASVELMRPEETLRFLGASYVRQDSGARLQLTFSEPIDYSGRDADAELSFWSGVRILNGLGQPMAYDETAGSYTTVADNADATPLQAVMGRLWDIVKLAQSNSIISLDQTQADAVEGLIGHLDALRLADPDGTYNLVFAISETGVKSDRGEATYNHFVDGIWSLNTDKVLLSDYVADADLGVADTAAAELQIYDADAYQTPEEAAKVLSATMTDLTDRRLTVTFDRPMHINKISGAYLTYEYAPSTSDEGFWQYSMQTVEYVRNASYVVVDGKEFSDTIVYYVNGSAITYPAGLRFSEYDLNNSAAKNDDMISPLKLEDLGGNGLYAPYVDNDNDLTWTPLTLDPSLYNITAAVRISDTQVRLLFAQPVTPAEGVSATAGDDTGKVWLIDSTADSVTLAEGDFTADYDGAPIAAATLTLNSETTGGPADGVYSFMNADTGRELAVGDVDEFTLTATAGGCTLTHNGQYLDLTGATPALTDQPITYSFTQAAYQRWQIGIGNGLIADSDGGTDATVTLNVVSNNHDVIQTGWYITAQGETRPHRVLFFGASKTEGVNTDFFDHGWRDTLSGSMTDYSDGRVVFVGSRLSHKADINSAELYRHEGWGGWVLDPIPGDSGSDSIALDVKVDADLIKYQPNIFFMDCGGNDVVRKNSASGGDILTNGVYSAAMDELAESMMATIRQYAPRIGEDGAFLIQTSSPTKEKSRTDEDLFTYMAQRHREMVGPLRAEGYNVFLNETSNGYPQDGGFCSDNHHNSDTGDAHVAARAFDSYLNLFNQDGTFKTSLDSLTTSLSNAGDGDIVYLYGDLTLDSELMVPAGITLDLCGNTLTVPAISAFGPVIDSSDGRGLLILTDTSPIFRADNPYLPLYDTDAGGYRLFRVSMNYRGIRKVDTDTVKFGVSPEFTNSHAYTLLLDAENAQASLSADIHIRYNGQSQDISYAFTPVILQRLASGMLDGTANTVVLTVSGVEVMESDDVITVAPKLISQTDAAAASTVGRYPDAGAVNPTPTDSIKILMIGNSFARDAATYIHDIAAAHGYDITVGVLYYGGGYLSHHVISLQSDTTPYIYYENGQQVNYYASMRYGLEKHDWDIISMQQNSMGGMDASTLNGDIDIIQNYAREYCSNPDFRFIWHATWAYKGLMSGMLPEDAYAHFYGNYADKIFNRSEMDFFVPSGTAIQNAKASIVGHDLHSDTLHLNDKGKYIVGYTWLASLTGVLPETLTYRISGLSLSDIEYAAIRQAVADAIAYPTTLTKQATNPYTAEADGIDLTQYTQLEFDYELGYWNPANTTKYNQVITSTSSTDIFPYQHIAISERFTSETLPVGSIIVVDSGWKARFRYWDEDVSHSGAGALLTGRYVVTEDDWDTEILRAIHLMDSSNTYLADAPDTHIQHLRIYIPNEDATVNADGIDMTQYVQLDPAIALGYWNPANTSSYNMPITASGDNYHAKHIAVLERFTPDTLPVGSIIVVDSGYAVRVRYWDTDVSHSGAGEKLTAGTHEITADYWDTEIYRAMHLMSEPHGTTFTDSDMASVFSHLRIYVPRTETVNDDGIDMAKFDLWEYDYEVGYYNPSNSSLPTSVITPTNGGGTYAQNFIAVSERVTAQTLPVGSIIVVDDGYYARFRYWNTDGYYANAGGETVTNRYAVGIQHWDTEIIRALHLSLSSVALMSDNVEEHISHLRIYIPKA